MRRLAWQVVLLVLVSNSARSLVAQEVGERLAGRGPRFLLPSAVTAKPMAVDAGSLPVLRRHIALDLDDVTVEEALTTISRAAGLRLVYSKAVVPLESRVRLQATSITVAGALVEVLMDAGVDVLLTAKGQAVLVKRPPARPLQLEPGSIVGRVTDAKTEAVLSGATVTVEGTSRRATAGSDGRYRLADVAPGIYTLRARYIGYAPGSISVTVSAGQEVSADLALAPSIAQLDQLVVTSTIAEAERKELPSPITVISSEQIEQKNIQHVDQLFRGEVPGVVSWNLGANPLATTDIRVRGGSDLLVSGGYVKTYIDGVEVASPSYLTLLDPGFIDHVELIRGPQASTVYGSGALNGVMQIFTKQGSGAGRAAVSAKASMGAIESQWVGGTPLQHDYALSVAEGNGDFSYNVGGSWLKTGAWLEDYGNRSTSAYGSARGSRGKVTAALSGRYYQQDIHTACTPLSQTFGACPPNNYQYTTQGLTFALTLRHRTSSLIQQSLTLGYDRLSQDGRNPAPLFRTPADTFLNVSNLAAAKPSVRYDVTFNVPMRSSLTLSTTGGVDYNKTESTLFDVRATRSSANLTGGSLNFGRRVNYENLGYFSQARLGVADRFFVTAGLRAEQNDNFGTEYGLSWSPRVGVAYVQGVGVATLKLRGSYGQATKAPNPDYQLGSRTATTVTLPSLQIAPERQRGVDAGLELYVGAGASLELTYYDQDALDLIDLVTLTPQTPTEPAVQQYQNVGRIHNRGLEVGGRLTIAGPLSVNGAYSLTRSTVRQLSPSYQGDLRVGDRLTGLPVSSAGATLAYRLPRGQISFTTTYFSGWTEVDWFAFFQDLRDGAFKGSLRAYWTEYPSLTKYSLAASHVIRGPVSAFVNVENLGNSYAFERDNRNATQGRVTTVGVRIR